MHKDLQCPPGRSGSDQRSGTGGGPAAGPRGPSALCPPPPTPSATRPQGAPRCPLPEALGPAPGKWPPNPGAGRGRPCTPRPSSALRLREPGIASANPGAGGVLAVGCALKRLGGCILTHRLDLGKRTRFLRTALETALQSRQPKISFKTTKQNLPTRRNIPAHQRKHQHDGLGFFLAGSPETKATALGSYCSTFKTNSIGFN